MRTLIGFTGYIGAGKSSAADMLVAREGANFVKMGFADPIREITAKLNPLFNVGVKHYALGNGTAHYADILRAVGYEGAKQIPAVRQFLQIVGTEAGRDILGVNVWVNELVDRVYALPETTNVAIVDVRYDNEANVIRNMDGFVVRVNRAGQESDSDHSSETGIDAIEPDFTITASDLDGLRNELEYVYGKIQEVVAAREAAYAEEAARFKALRTSLEGQAVPSGTSLPPFAVTVAEIPNGMTDEQANIVLTAEKTARNYALNTTGMTEAQASEAGLDAARIAPAPEDKK